MAPKAAAEKRIDPDDGQAYTYEELAKFYKDTYQKAAIKSYWESCKLASEPKAAAKAKAKAKAKVKKEPRVIKAGDKFPKSELHLGFPPDKVDMQERLKEKKVVILSLPGAFTPC
mmetsp:Transcript_4172/g.13348  ORF Transcript_4172/g.13348 Transcript_4172/m.13348 type:complete len:115 (-) Transcript_4172:837-1181(-)